MHPNVNQHVSFDKPNAAEFQPASFFPLPPEFQPAGFLPLLPEFHPACFPSTYFHPYCNQHFSFHLRPPEFQPANFLQLTSTRISTSKFPSTYFHPNFSPKTVLLYSPTAPPENLLADAALNSDVRATSPPTTLTDGPAGGGDSGGGGGGVEFSCPAKICDCYVLRPERKIWLNCTVPRLQGTEQQRALFKSIPTRGSALITVT